jgi:hypothetical protein
MSSVSLTLLKNVKLTEYLIAFSMTEYGKKIKLIAVFLSHNSNVRYFLFSDMNIQFYRP